MDAVLLISGAAGFIGSQMVRTALAQGYRVVGLDKLTYAGSVANVDGLPADRFRLVVGDIADLELVRGMLAEVQPASVLNLAAETHVDRSIAGPDAFVETNVVGTLHLLRASLDYYRTLTGDRRSRFRYVQMSTDEVYGSLGEAGRFSEDSSYAPRSPYASSKAGGDHLVAAWVHTYGLPAVVTHCSNNYGPRQHPEKLIPHMITRALAGLPLPVYGTGENVRDWIHVEDHCDGVLAAMRQGTVGGHYCFGGGNEWRNIDLVHRLCDALDVLKPRADRHSYRRQIAFVDDRPGHDFRYSIDFSRATRELGFAPKVDFADGLAATVRWYLDNGGEGRKAAEESR